MLHDTNLRKFITDLAPPSVVGVLMVNVLDDIGMPRPLPTIFTRESMKFVSLPELLQMFPALPRHDPVIIQKINSTNPAGFVFVMYYFAVPDGTGTPASWSTEAGFDLTLERCRANSTLPPQQW